MNTMVLLVWVVVAVVTLACIHHQAQAHPSPAWSPARMNQLIGDQSKTANEKLSRLCKNIGSIKHISIMEQLIDNLKKVMPSPDYADFLDQLNRQPSSWLAHLTSPDPMLACLQQADSILALDLILQEKNNVCHSSHIDQIESYHQRFSAGSSPGRPTALTRHFFKLYASQVAFQCKSNLLRSLKSADKRFIKPAEYDKVMPWLLSNGGDDVCPTTGLLKLSSLQQQQQQQPPEPVASAAADSLQRCSARQALADIKSISELVEAFEGFDSASSNATSNPIEQHDQSLYMIISESQRQLVDNVLDSCRKFESIYSHTVMPIVRLTRMGYDPKFENFNKLCRQDNFVHRWFSITLICTSMLRLGDKKYGTSAELDESLVIVDKIDEPTDETAHSGDVEENETRVARQQEDIVFKNPIEDELWVAKYIPNTMSKLKSGFYKRISKIFKLETVENHIVFRQTMSDTGRFLISIILISLALVGVNSIN